MAQAAKRMRIRLTHEDAALMDRAEDRGFASSKDRENLMEFEFRGPDRRSLHREIARAIHPEDLQWFMKASKWFEGW